MHWPRQHGVVAAGRPACVCRGSVGRFLAGGSFARELSSSSGSAGSSVQKRCSGPAAGRGPSLHRRSFPERAGVPALCTGAVEPCSSTATYATDPTSTSEQLGIHALIDIVEQTNCWQKAECKEWSFLFDT